MHGLRMLSEGEAISASEYGGKAAGLGRLMSMGVLVPEGFALPAGLKPTSQWPAALRDEVLTHLRQLEGEGPSKVAVRSSAVGEDGADRSFAGLLHTRLEVMGEEAVLRAIDDCLASGSGERVIAYTRGEGLKHVGVVVQRMVPALSAGVTFTRDPSGQDHAMVLEAVPGLGEALVSGRATPTRWRIYRSGLGKLEVRQEGRGKSRQSGVPAPLEPLQVATLASEALSLEQKFGMPLDLEWAFDKEGRLYWLQARPITVAHSPLEYLISRGCPEADDGPVTVWSNFNVRETMPLPLPPLTWTLWRDIILPQVLDECFGVSQKDPRFRSHQSFDLVHGRMYWNLNGILATPVVGALIKRVLHVIDAPTSEAVQGLIASGVLRPRRIQGNPWATAFAMMLANLRMLGSLLGTLNAPSMLLRLETAGDRIRSRGPVEKLTDAEVLREMKVLFLPEVKDFRSGLVAIVPALLSFLAADHAFAHDLEARQLLTTGLIGPTSAISLELDALVLEARPFLALFRAHFERAPEDALEADLRSRSDVPPARSLLTSLEEQPGGAVFTARFRSFMERNGQRAPGEFDLGLPRWREAPERVLELVYQGLNAPAGPTLSERFEALRKRREAALERAMSSAPLWKRPLLHFLEATLRFYSPVREAPKHHAMHAFYRMREASLEAGRRLAARGVIRAADDVFFLEWEEVETLLGKMAFRLRGADLHARIEERRASFARFALERAPDVLRSDGVPVEAQGGEGEDDGVTLRGTPISLGRVEGKVRVLRTPDPSAFEDGDILVMSLADPGWTPLFPRAGGLIMEVGGVVCHAAVVAREMGVPAVFGVNAATTRLVDGERVRLDGSSGLIMRLEP